MPLQVYYVRHGETAWSRSGQHTSRTDLPLTEQGEQNARNLAGRLSSVRFSRVFTSLRQRARRTCELAGLGTAAQTDPDLAEWDYGDYEGLRLADILAGALAGAFSGTAAQKASPPRRSASAPTGSSPG